MTTGGKVFATGLTVLAVLAVFVAFFVDPRLQANKVALLGRGDYRLQMTDGGTFTQDTLKGAPSAVFFGFTHCPDVCPTTMGDISTWKEDLPEAEKLKVYFVSVDPERDTLDVLTDYTSWVPGVIGVTGQFAQAAKAVDAFNIYAVRMPLAGGDYTMAHTSYVMLFDENGLFVETIPYQSDPAVAEEKIANLLAGNPAGRGARMPDDLLGAICYTLQGSML